MSEDIYVKSLREKLRLTQDEFAKKIGVKVRTVGSWEQGTRAIGYKNRNKICETFGITHAEFLGGTPQVIKITGSATAGGMVTVDHPKLHTRATEIDLGTISVAGTEGICVHGDSMFPLAQDGDTIIFNKSLATKNGDLVYIKLDNEQAFFKRYTVLDPKKYNNFSPGSRKIARKLPSRIMLQGINQAIHHTPIIALEKEIKFIYKVVGIIFK